MATHSSVLAWRLPGMGEPGGLLSMGSHRVEHDWSDLAVAYVYTVKKVKEVTVLPWRGFIQALCWEGSFPRNTRRCLAGSISGRIKTLPMVMRDQGREGNFWGQGEPVQPPAIWGFLAHSLRVQAMSPGRGQRGQSKWGEVRPLLLSLACPISRQGASTWDLLGLSFRLGWPYSGSHDPYSQLANPLQAWGHGLHKPWNRRSSGQFPLKCTEQMGPH